MTIRWFFAPAGARLAPQPHWYMPKVWDDGKAQASPPVGDLKGTRLIWDDAGNTEGYTGEIWCGLREAWNRAGEPGYSAPLMRTDARGVLPCCILAELIGTGGVGIGGDSLWPVEIAGKLVGGGFAGSALTWSANYQGSLVGSGFTRSMNSYRPMYEGVLVGSGETVSASTWSANYQGSLAGGGLTGAGLTWSANYQGSLAAQGASSVTVTPGFFSVSGSIHGSGYTQSTVDVDPMITGMFFFYPSITPPAGCLLCNGGTFSSVTYPALAALLGDTFGVHSGTTYYLPGPAGRSMVAAGSGSGLTTRTPGQSGGVESVLLSGLESGVRDHLHQLPGYVGAFAAGASASAVFSGGPNTSTLTSPVSGGSLPAQAAHENMHPWLCPGYLMVKA